MGPTVDLHCLCWKLVQIPGVDEEGLKQFPGHGPLCSHSLPPHRSESCRARDNGAWRHTTNPHVRGKRERSALKAAEIILPRSQFTYHGSGGGKLPVGQCKRPWKHCPPCSPSYRATLGPGSGQWEGQIGTHQSHYLFGPLLDLSPR